MTSFWFMHIRLTLLICIGVIVDLTACWSYCSYKNYKEISKKLAVQTAEQFFACYDTKKHFLYMSDFNKKGFVEQYLSDSDYIGVDRCRCVYCSGVRFAGKSIRQRIKARN